MDRHEAIEALALLKRVVRQARDDSALNNWGVIWMLHAFTNAFAFVSTDVLVWRGYGPPEIAAMWGAVVVLNVALALGLRKRSGARTFVETQMWGIWLAFIGAMPLLGLLNALRGLERMAYAPMIGVLAAFAFSMMGMLMSRAFFGAAALFVATAIAMALHPEVQYVILGVVWGAAQFAWGLALHLAGRRGAALV